MKMTPEQKAFFKYGEARVWLKAVIEKMRNNSRIRFKKEYKELHLEYRLDLCELFNLKGYILSVRKKRAACRAWAPMAQRECRT